MKNSIFIFFFITISLFLQGCVQKSHTRNSKNIYWNTALLHSLAKKAAISFLKSNIATQKKPIKRYAFLCIKNSTYDHIDTKMLTDTIKQIIVQHSHIKVVKLPQEKALCEILQHEHYNTKTISDINNKHQIDGLFYGEISAIYQKNSRAKDLSFIFTYNFVDITNTITGWSETIPIRQRYKRQLIGW